MNFLCLLGGGGFSSSNGPDGFVGNDYIIPVVNVCLDCCHLSLIDSHGVSSLSFLKLFTNAGNDLKVVFQGMLCLQSNNFITLTEDVSSF